MRERATRVVERIRRVASIGQRYDPDEILLVLTLRIQLELLDQLLREFVADCIGTLPENLVQGADDELSHLLGRRDLRTVVSSARKQIRKNWGAPITSAWLVDS